MPKQNSTADVIADILGHEIATLIRDNTSSREVRSVSFGGADVLAFTDIKNVLPGVWIRPTGQSVYTSREQSATLFDVTDQFRMSVAASYDESQNPESEVSEIARKCVRVLRRHRALTGANIDDYQIVDSNIVSVDWDPFENDLFRSMAVPIRVVSVIHAVRWLTK